MGQATQEARHKGKATPHLVLQLLAVGGDLLNFLDLSIWDGEQFRKAGVQALKVGFSKALWTLRLRLLVGFDDFRTLKNPFSHWPIFSLIVIVDESLLTRTCSAPVCGWTVLGALSRMLCN